MVNSKTGLFKGLITAAAIFAASTVAHAQGSGDQTPVRLGWLKASLSTIVQAIAEQKDLYAKNGLDATITAVGSGNNASGIEALMRGDFDVYFGPMSEMARLNAVAVEQKSNPPLVAVGVGTPGASHLVLKKGLAYEGLESLKGKTIGVSSPGSIHLIMFRHFLGEHDQTTEGLGLNIVRVAGSDMVPALLTGQIDGFLHSQPTPAIAVANDAGFVAIPPSEMGEVGQSPTSAVMVRRDWAEKNPEAVKKVLRAFRQASEAFSEMSEDELVAIAQESIGAEPEVLKSAIPYVNPRLMDDFETAADIYWKTEIAAMKGRGEIVEEYEKQHMFDFSYGNGN
ncbi:hypothetical protein GCM10011385_34010 [Nitratireductor aestuarii]|uniref:ABC transporter substrate-binding protein n=1 Tax=Nitratireductor aestuarii TaxID=1735103 RepID=A0A916W870_9HYPH|nr:ABC transporter substrate-binding protein [Nitratireductor aestuarii]GGA77106.1 hypothetical protein GCM10011385_34010 [Nitratireductor aestuarii]